MLVFIGQRLGEEIISKVNERADGWVSYLIKMNKIGQRSRTALEQIEERSLNPKLKVLSKTDSLQNGDQLTLQPKCSYEHHMCTYYK